MPYLTKDAMRAAGTRHITAQRNLAKSDRTISTEAITFDADITYDVFLSHAVRDRLLVLGVKRRLESEDLRVYVDWIDDADLDRTAVTEDNARRLRARLRLCKSLVYLVTNNASKSRWMPWELGYFNGRGKGPIGILPVLDDPDESFEGQEFLGLYPVIKSLQTKAQNTRLFMTEPGKKAIRLARAIEQASTGVL